MDTTLSTAVPTPSSDVSSSRRRSSSPNYARRVSSSRSTSVSPSRKFLQNFLKSSSQQANEAPMTLKSESSLVLQSLETDLPIASWTQFKVEDLISHIQIKLKENMALVREIQLSVDSMEMKHLHVATQLGHLQYQLRHARGLDVRLQKSCEQFRKSLESFCILPSLS